MDLRPELGSIAAPTLVVVGEDDFICDVVSAREMADGHPRRPTGNHRRGRPLPVGRAARRVSRRAGSVPDRGLTAIGALPWPHGTDDSDHDSGRRRRCVSGHARQPARTTGPGAPRLVGPERHVPRSGRSAGRRRVHRPGAGPVRWSRAGHHRGGRIDSSRTSWTRRPTPSGWSPAPRPRWTTCWRCRKRGAIARPCSGSASAGSMRAGWPRRGRRSRPWSPTTEAAGIRRSTIRATRPPPGSAIGRQTTSTRRRQPSPAAGREPAVGLAQLPR